MHGAAATAAGKVGAALDFDGVDDHVAVAGGPRLNPPVFSFEAWVRLPGLPGEDVGVVSKSASLRIRADGLVQLHWAVDGDEYGVVSTNPVSPGEWVHLAGSYDGATAAIIINGVLNSTIAAARGPEPTGEPLTIGSINTESGFMRGRIDEVRIFAFARSAAEVRVDLPFRVVFEDDFETDRGWTFFEEIVGGSACYGSGIGSAVLSTDVARSGAQGYLTWANQAASIKSNHLIGSKQVHSAGKTGIWRYELYAYIDPATAATGQTGPELSIQNTREVSPGVWRTLTAGVQYISNPFDVVPDAWSIWIEQSPNVAWWEVLFVEPLTAGEWYFIALEFDYDSNVYIELTIQGPGVDRTIDLSGYTIAEEIKFSVGALWITAESENIWNNCGAGGATQNRVFYDDVVLYRR